MPPPKYLPLVRYLAVLPAEQASVTLSFAELEALVGPLAVSVRTSQSNWAGVRAAGYWRVLDFTPRLNYLTESVTFTRRANERATP